MVLNYDQIKRRCGSMPPLIENVDLEKNKNNPAKIELSLGSRCYCSNDSNTIQQLKAGDSITIEPNEVFLFQTKEKINMHRDLVGNMSLKMSLVAKGLLMPSQTQIDPGYRNYVYGMFYNLSSEPIIVKYGDSIVTVEFRTTKACSTNYSGLMEKITFEEFLTNRISCSLGSIKSLKQETDSAICELRKSTTRWNTTVTAFSVVLAIIAGIVTLTGFFSNKEADLKIGHLEEKISSQAILLDSYEKQLSDLEEKYYQLLVDEEN